MLEFAHNRRTILTVLSGLGALLLSTVLVPMALATDGKPRLKATVPAKHTIVVTARQFPARATVAFHVEMRNCRGDASRTTGIKRSTRVRFAVSPQCMGTALITATAGNAHARVRINPRPPSTPGIATPPTSGSSSAPASPTTTARPTPASPTTASPTTASPTTSPSSASTGPAVTASPTATDTSTLTMSMFPGTRDAALWPFSSTSPWNTPIGSNATYLPSDAPNWPTPQVNFLTRYFGQPIYIAKASDPMVNVYDSNGKLYGRFNIPADATPATGVEDGTKGGLNIVNPAHTMVLSMSDVSRDANGDTHSFDPRQTDLRGEGLCCGSQAYGGPQIAGIIRKGEITNGIHHALATSASRSSLNMNPAPYVWPARSADSGWQTTYGTRGHLHMGSLAAIPKSVDLTKFGFSPAKLSIAKAMQDYGVYIVDAGPEGANAVFVAEPDAESELPNDWNSGTDVYKLLQIVTNNSATSVGGGGTPLAPIAPPFSS